MSKSPARRIAASAPHHSGRRRILLLLLTVMLVLGVVAPAGAALQIRRPDSSVAATFVGKGGYSSDGLGQFGTGGTLQAVVPPGSTVKYAFLYGTYFFNDTPDLAQRTITIDSTDVVTTRISGTGGCCSLSTTFADVTNLVKAKVGSGGGAPFNFAVNNDPSDLDGVALVVIFSNPSLPQTTIAVLDGSASQTGDQATFNFAQPIDKTAAGFNATLALGSGFSYQGGYGPTHQCGGGQFSRVEINGSLLTNCAGHYDDGDAGNGALITVGGVGDSTDNPTPPDAPATDDELYNVAPFLQQGATSLTITTSNPSQDDNLFLAVISTSASAAVTTEVCDNGTDDDSDTRVDDQDPDCYAITLQNQGSSTNPVGQPHTVKASVRNVKTNGPASGKVLFRVTGANTASGSQTLNGSGEATFTYTGTNAGQDDIRACYDQNNNTTCDDPEPKATVQKTWTGSTTTGNPRMTSYGFVAGYNYGSLVDCDPALANARARPFTIQWTDGGIRREFKATNYLVVKCDTDTAFPVPAAGFNRQDGTVEGTFKVGFGSPQPGYRLIWRLIDGGGSPAADRTGLIIKDPQSRIVISVAPTPLGRGYNTATR